MRYLPDGLLVEWSSDKYPGGIPKNFPSKVEAAFHALNYGLFENKVSRCSVVVDKIKERPERKIAGQAMFLDRPRQSQTSMSVNGNVYNFSHSESATITIQNGRVNVHEPHRAQRKLENADQYKITLNFRTIESLGFMRVLSTLAHEMCHVHEFIYADYKTHHSPYWAKLMRSIGLSPYALANNKPCELGLGMGDTVSHEIDDSGAFKRIAHQLIGEYSFERD